MSSRHLEQAVYTRPPAALRKETQALLKARERSMDAFLTACLAALAAAPDTFMDQLAPHWPPPKPRGRPPTRREP